MIEIKNISKIYKNGDEETSALKNISFTIKEGEFVAIMGPSGSGKSTLMHILGCLDTPNSGSYVLDGHDVSKISDDNLAKIRMDKIGFVFQAYNLLRRTTVLRNVMLPLVYAGVPREEREHRAGVALASIGFPEDRWYHHSNQISGGQMQRVAIARALVNNPSIILADEPTGNLDTKTSSEIMELLVKLNLEAAITVVLVTHEADIAAFSRRIIKFLDGSIVSDVVVKKHDKSSLYL